VEFGGREGGRREEREEKEERGERKERERGGREERSERGAGRRKEGTPLTPMEGKNFFADNLRIQNCNAYKTTIRCHAGEVWIMNSEFRDNVANYGAFISLHPPLRELNGTDVMNVTNDYETDRRKRKIAAYTQHSYYLQNNSIYNNFARIAGGAFFIFEPFPVLVPLPPAACDTNPKICDNSAGFYGNFAAGTGSRLVVGHEVPFPGQRFDINVTLVDRFNNIVRRGATPKRQEARSLIFVHAGNSVIRDAAVYSNGVALYRGLMLSSGGKTFFVNDSVTSGLNVTFTINPSDCCPPGYHFVYCFFPLF
jgi:hypothetical protein